VLNCIFPNYSQVLITGRPISGKSQYPDGISSGYRIIMATLYGRPIQYALISGPDIIAYV
jgi:hypothetical protein